MKENLLKSLFPKWQKFDHIIFFTKVKRLLVLLYKHHLPSYATHISSVFFFSC